MYFLHSHSFILTIIPFFTAAILLAKPPTSPISKRINLPVADPSLYASRIQTSIRDFPGCSAPVTFDLYITVSILQLQHIHRRLC